MYPQLIPSQPAENTGYPSFLFNSSSNFNKHTSTFSEIINTLDSKELTLKENIYINITDEDDCYRIEYDELNIWATGETIDEVLQS